MTSTPQETEIQQVPHPPPPPSPKADQEAEFHEPTSSATVTEESQPTDHPPASDEETKKWGTHVMGPPSAPNVHPDNQQAALWNANRSTQKSFEPVIHKFQEWGRNADTVARNIWHNLKTGPSVPQAAWGKVKPDGESNHRGDRPLCHTAPSGEEAWSYYKVMIPLEKISTVNSEIMIENPSRKYIQIVTTDEHDFWFMGFVNFEKGLAKSIRERVEFQGSRRCKSTSCCVANDCGWS
ncbi:hypothetical protein OIU84_026791 [Salix udensis]|uniref:GRAM domain-containing protein n=1 Tax=Salix udensis TaxID=889485 RepID=A0AAD6KMM9_9ROSI|nr:hypothetical protein OIU84_026791 [Salix udensis]